MASAAPEPAWRIMLRKSAAQDPTRNCPASSRRWALEPGVPRYRIIIGAGIFVETGNGGATCRTGGAPRS
jgi:hypothetical protein